MRSRTSSAARRRRPRRSSGKAGRRIGCCSDEVLHQADYMHMLPTRQRFRPTDTRLLQGRTGLWFAGGYLFPYDAQETALLSALEVVNGLNGGSPRGTALLSSV